MIEELWHESRASERCPHISYDEDRQVCRCGVMQPVESAELVCGIASLQLWCLDPERFQNCVFYQEFGLQPPKTGV